MYFYCAQSVDLYLLQEYSRTAVDVLQDVRIHVIIGELRDM